MLSCNLKFYVFVKIFNFPTWCTLNETQQRPLVINSYIKQKERKLKPQCESKTNIRAALFYDF